MCFDSMLVLIFLSFFFFFFSFNAFSFGGGKRWSGSRVKGGARSTPREIEASLRYELGRAVGVGEGRGGGDDGRWKGGVILPLHQLVARAGRLVVFYCVLRGPVYRHGPEQTTAAELEEIHQVPEATVAGGGEGEGGRESKQTNERENKQTNEYPVDFFCFVFFLI